MGISGLLGEFVALLMLILSNFRKISSVYQDLKIAPHASRFFRGRRAASVFSWEPDLFVFGWDNVEGRDEAC